MKPLWLEMNAFGPYRNAKVDFELFGDGIYVITGPTGAGKTTIFDAVMFALFEEVSAKHRDKTVEEGSTRDKSMVHSDYVSKEIPTEVRLCFEEQGQKYTVRRTVRFPKPRAGGFGSTKFEAELEGNGIHATGSEKVTAAVEKILCMDAIRFRQIVMLAQGEFKAFMTARDDQRKEILGELFDSTPYRLFQERLAEAAKKLREDQKALQTKVVNALSPEVFLLPDGLSPEEAALYTADHPQLEETLAALVTSDNEALAQLEAREKQFRKEQEALTEKKGKADAENLRYEELMNKRSHLQELEAQGAQMQRAEQELCLTEKARHQVQPAEKAKDKAEEDARKKEAEYQKLLAEIPAAQQKAAEAQLAAEQNPVLQEKANGYADAARRIRENISKLSEREATLGNLEKAKKALAAAEKERDAADNAKLAAEDEIRRINDRLSALEDADEIFISREKEYQASADRLAAFTAPRKGFLARVQELRKDGNRLAVLVAKAAKANQEAAAAAEEYSSLYSRYLAGYAGKLGMELENTLNTSGRACCPVCRTAFHKGVPHEFAVAESDAPDDAALKAAEAKRREAQKADAEAGSSLDSAKQVYQDAVSRVIDELNEQYPMEYPWEWGAASEQQLHNAVEALTAAKECCLQALNAADKNRQEKKTLTIERDKQGRLKTAAIEACGKADSAVSKATGQIAGYSKDEARLGGEIRQAGLDAFASAEDAENSRKELEAKQQQFEKAIEKANKTLVDAREALTGLNSKQDTMMKTLLTAQDHSLREKEAYEKALAEAGFADDTAYFIARDRVGNVPADLWIEQERNRVNAYRNDRKNTAERIRELEKQPPVCTDLSELNQQLADIDIRLRALSDQIGKLKFRAMGHENAYRTKLEANRELAPLSLACRRVSSLAEMANGTSSEGGRRAFDGYVLSATFREVLEHASFYLTDMTGGKYELIHDTEGTNVRRNAAADFRFQVQDTITGQLRDIGSLSGGESFQASMALALGLSDTVQSHVSTVKIDTMFIDEGFGSLDTDSLHRMLGMLSGLSGGHRQIAIISHVDALEESANKFIRVTGSRDKHGSALRQEM